MTFDRFLGQKLTTIFLLPLILSGCSSKLDQLERMCEKHAELEILNPEKWEQYKNDMLDKDKFGNWGDPYISEFGNYKIDTKTTKMGRKYKKERLTLSEDGNVISKITDVSTQWQGFDSRQHASCTTAFPQIYFEL